MATAKVTEPKMHVRAIAPWFGGKRTLGPEIVQHFGPHRAYWDVFAGSLAVLLAKEPATMETAIDLHGDLTNLAFVLKDEGAASDLYGRLARTILSREVFLASAAMIQADRSAAAHYGDVERAYHYMVVSWFGRNGVAGTANYQAGFCVRYTANGGHAAKRFQSAVESIPAWHHRLRNVTVLREDTFQVIDRIEDREGTVVYADPPYFKKGAKYMHDFGEGQHAELAAKLRRFERTRVVVSYYDEPEVREMYAGWNVIPMKANKALANQGMRDKAGATVAPEVLIINEPPPSSAGMLW